MCHILLLLSTLSSPYQGRQLSSASLNISDGQRIVACQPENLSQ